ncbi:NADH-quinone oxidoreductase subunit N [Microbulbifer yueqingensis]|uniref:NADH-quinone oxidoreductase subunit N n=1 Tax=Microbulbifer yueqingensis TaxID=658219 RepID=A0A1G8WZR5_9GAMM|nr:NADH-quinone oxidoreductase subunit N [Microbulbifer yueqingensis]SDJ83075.1 NADH dehydrogenase subunit N [Microbulbifer yueqingensis]
MTREELFAILPLLVLTGGIVLLMLQVSLRRGHRPALATTLAVLLVALWACFTVAADLPADGAISATMLFRIDHTALFFCVLLLLAALATAVLGFHHLLSRASNQDGDAYPEEFYILLLLVMLGACSLVCASHFASLFLGLELMGLSLYPLLGFSVIGSHSPQREQLLSLESGMKYLLLSALATALTLFGIALVFAASGALDFTAAAATLRESGPGNSVFSAGLTLLLVGMAFKLSLVPFHIWTPDVYQGAPTPVTALIATVSKGAVVALVLRLFGQVDLFSVPVLSTMLAVMAIASMLVGNLLALLQSNVKRLLAYSSIAHIGYLMVAFLIGASAFGQEAVTYYLVAYVVTTMGAFAVISLVADTALSSLPGGTGPISDPSNDPYQIEFYRGMFWRSPALACCFGLMLLSLAGIPLTIGFIGKFYVFAAGVQGNLWYLLAAVVIGSALGLYYYLRLLLVMVQCESGSEALAAGEVNIAASGKLLVIGLTGALLLFGIFPQLLINWVNAL